MHRFSVLLALVLAVFCAATEYGVQRTDFFEDLGDAPGVINAPPVNSDGGVIYNSFGLSQGRVVGTPQIAGVRPHSGTHYTITQRPAVGSLATSGRCVIVHNLYVGCINADAQAAVNKPLSCLITLTSFDGKGNQNGVQKETYTPNDALLADMMKIEVKLPAAAVVQLNATILGETPLGGVGALVTGLFVDDVTYTEYDNNALGAQKCGRGF